MTINIDKHIKYLSDIRKMNLREHIGKGYNLAEVLDWCDPESDYEIHRREKIGYNTDRNKSIVPIISSDFDDHDSARKAYTNLQRETNSVDIEVYDVHYNQAKKKVTIILKPFEL